MTVHPAFHLADLDALDSASRLPLYAQLADMLAKRIRSSQDRLAGRALPSELELTKHFGISRPTVRQAMSHLQTEELIVRGRGRGTFVAPPRASRDLGRAFEFEVLPANHRVEFRLMSRKRVMPEPSVRKLFELRDGEPIERLTRLRFVDDRIFGLEERFMPLRNAAKITDAMLNREAGIVFARRLIKKENGRVVFRVRAIAADAEIACLLEVKKGAPLLSSEHTYFSPEGEPVLHGTVLFRGDRYDFSFQAPVHGA
jgi:GntR family transcriptional regulator